MTFDIHKELAFKPEVKNEKLFNFDNVVAGGMGGSALAARSLFYLDPIYPIWLHNDYGFPEKAEGKALCIAISYSGNTDETESFADAALKRGLPLAIIASGGSLIELAKKENIPYVLVPGGVQPRDAVVYMLKSLLAILGRPEQLEELERVEFATEEIEKEAKDLANFLSSGLSAIYSAYDSATLAYIWKIMLNETAKIPAFYNLFPELTHNELQAINENQRTLLLTTGNENHGVKKEMEAYKQISGERGWLFKEVSLEGSQTEILVKNLLLARATAWEIARMRGVDPENIELVEAFKKKL